jgi:hypothetical protein
MPRLVKELTLTRRDGMFILHSKKRIKVTEARPLNRIFPQALFSVLFGISALCHHFFIQPLTALAETESSSTVTSSILEVPSSDNGVTLTFTLFTVKNVQYFSGGVGIEERMASYPAYPLKLIFVQGERAFLAEVNISIAESDGNPLIDIPSENVTGPWLFIQLPSGTYTITAVDSHQRVIKKKVQVGERGTRVVHFRWPAI